MWSNRQAAAVDAAATERRAEVQSHFAKIAEVPIQPLLAELGAAPELWQANTSRQRKVQCQRHTENIFLRIAKKPLPPGAKNANDVHESRLARTAAKLPRALGFCESVSRSVSGKLGRAMLVSLLPGCRVYPHIDTGAYYRIRDRYHLVLSSEQGSPLTAGDETVVMREGELWAFDNKVRHWAENPSSTRRIHLIFDVLPKPGTGHFALPL